MALLDDDGACLEDAGFLDDHSILVEVRSRDGTWPEEITSLATTTNHGTYKLSNLYSLGRQVVKIVL